MQKVRCHECGKVYNFDEDDFCPRCGAFTQPPKSVRVDASGNVVRLDGINEKNHAGSFVHEELHEENRERRRTGLSKGVRRTSPVQPRPTSARPAGQTGGSGKGKSSPVSWVFLLIGIIIALRILGSVLQYFLFYWI